MVGRKRQDQEIIDYIEDNEFATPPEIARALSRNAEHTRVRMKALAKEGRISFNARAKVYHLSRHPESGEPLRLGLVACTKTA